MNTFKVDRLKNKNLLLERGILKSIYRVILIVIFILCKNYRPDALFKVFFKVSADLTNLDASVLFKSILNAFSTPDPPTIHGIPR